MSSGSHHHKLGHDTFIPELYIKEESFNGPEFIQDTVITELQINQNTTDVESDIKHDMNLSDKVSELDTSTKDPVFSDEYQRNHFKQEVLHDQELDLVDSTPSENLADSTRQSDPKDRAALIISGNTNPEQPSVPVREDKHYMCGVCHYSFKNKKDLTRHGSYVHSDYRPFKCDQCGYNFKAKGNLNCHIKQVHSDKRPFSCPQCSFRCKNKNNLNRHMAQAHSDERPFSCVNCQYSCKALYQLEMHMKHVHSEERPFSCSQCQYRCKAKSNLTKHITHVHSDEPPSSCSLCNYSCKGKRLLAYHMKRAHKK